MKAFKSNKNNFSIGTDSVSLKNNEMDRIKYQFEHSLTLWQSTQD